ncbi:VID27 cytoplasmic protein-domain-containing protein [Syncephalis pseudoplumigaleata]|uniref:VID27 cytoplasmic protein-domain-containing protein n=1 Tax=Syncephalis pseudoplumigaleata TaxID=1712513 RepID=A0A4P9YVD3_9FUNG|nr:VID27 cytoplasmic protein-domain-containing protein [Syncephalis pseudoplumigaleata]|eukprot:RKP23755.1 VID27 cytoplasmic protein-domain-containing protein [Syncephalis pseudoplumigaleata]
MFKTIGSLIWGGEQDPTVATLSSGQLFKRWRKKNKPVQELIFKDAQAAIRRTSTRFQYQLVVTPVYKEGEEALLEEQGQELPDDYVQLLDAELNLYMEQADGITTFTWRQPSSVGVLSAA